MSGTCAGIVDGAFLPSVLGFVDCQAQAIGSGGYQALAAPGSSLSLMLTGLLTLFIAFFGYRMLFGQVPGVRDGVVALVKIGIVLALATSWAAYRTLAYDVVFHAPAELVDTIGAPAGLPGAQGGIAERLGQVDNALIELNRLGVGGRTLGTIDTVRTVNGQQVTVEAPVQEPSTIFGSSGLGTARLVFLTATIAGFASVRLVAGLLLALGPFFIAFLLFEGTRGLFEGWIRGIVAAIIGAVAVTILLGIELALLEPWLGQLIALRQADRSIAGADTELLVVALAFALALLAGLGMSARVAIAFRLPAAWRAAAGDPVAQLRPEEAMRPAVVGGPERQPSEQHSRAAAVAEAVAGAQRREVASTASAGAPGRTVGQGPTRDVAVATPTPLGQSYRRRTQGRVSASAGRRDRNA
ncbi:type IV secretion system protein [Sphingomonas sp. JC676]|uniref:type IV secretion system protein n=1 Tax=Sphingomonas sp. JC676 TaxID=2768065 RepID=UPI0016581887|nr:type IV secretion system protein [Sphingomonas sp. JC676]MBC9033001.1 type IV secretion system protein [Sphingomonas sp. JC676]